MCGIAGIIGKEIERKDKLASLMSRAITHRGPDDDGFFSDEYVALAMRRLSIIDIEGGHQPITTEDGRYVLVFNGEIYNYKELKKELSDYDFKTESDTEVVLAGFLKWGEKLFPKLRGMFGFSIYDTEEKKLFLVRDFFGIKPIYYFKYEGKIVAFASEIKSMLALPGFAREVNDAAVFNYLSYQYNPLEETFFKGVYKLLPGHYMEIDAETGQGKAKRYWQLEFEPDGKLDEEKAKKKIAQVMKDSVEHHMIADVPVGSFLSGGIDSSIIATLMQKIRGDSKVKTFTVTFGSVSEGVEARETAEPLGTEHKEISVGSKEYFDAIPKALWHFDEPVADPSALGLYFLSREAAKEVKVVLSGEGADELFGGYNIYLEPYSRRKISWIPEFALRLIAHSPIRGRNFARRTLERLEERYIGNAKVFDISEARRIWRGPEQAQYSLKDIYSEAKGLSDSAKMQHVDVRTWLVGDILAKADKMSMAHSLELRVPFLDTEVARLARVLPDSFKWRGRTTKYLLREAFKKVLPESTRNRRKLGFPTPIREWFGKDSQEAYQTIFNSPYIKEKLDIGYIREIIGEHRTGRADHSRKIYLLYCLAVWYNIFIAQKDF